MRWKPVLKVEQGPAYNHFERSLDPLPWQRGSNCNWSTPSVDLTSQEHQRLQFLNRYACCQHCSWFIPHAYALQIYSRFTYLYSAIRLTRRVDVFQESNTLRRELSASRYSSNMPEPQGLPTRFPCWCRAVYSWGGEV